MRMIPARFVRVPRWIPCYFITHNLLIFQEIMSISKTCNQLSVTKEEYAHRGAQRGQHHGGE